MNQFRRVHGTHLVTFDSIKTMESATEKNYVH